LAILSSKGVIMGMTPETTYLNTTTNPVKKKELYLKNLVYNATT